MQLMGRSGWKRRQRERSSAGQKRFQELSSGTGSLPSPDGNSLSSSERHEGFVLGHQMASASENNLLLLAQTWLLGQVYSIPSH